jgi:hypothetical protein
MGNRRNPRRRDGPSLDPIQTSVGKMWRLPSILFHQVFFNADGNFPRRTSRCTSSSDWS